MIRETLTRAAATLFLLLVPLPALAVAVDLVVDVPTTLSGTTFTPNQIVHHDDSGYSVAVTLPEGTQILALDSTRAGAWLFVPSRPVTLGSGDYGPRDVVSYDGAQFARYFDGGSAGIPPYARIDALFLDATGHLVFSFDVPVNLEGTEYTRSDLVRYGPPFSLYWNAQSAGVPSYANLVGAAEDGATGLAVSFDVPTQIGGMECLPGELVRWSESTTLGTLYVDAGWPAGSQLRDFGFTPEPTVGAIPDGARVPGVPLTVDRAAGDQIALRWGSACGPGGTDFEVYEGILGNFSSHTPRFCSTGGAMTKTLVPAGPATYYLVVPRSASREGSYGRKSDGAERSQGAAACLPQESASCP